MSDQSGQKSLKADSEGNKNEPEIDPKLLEMLVCPITHGPLRYDREKQELINKAEGTAAEIKLKADATAGAITVVAEALNKEGGEQAANLEVAKQYVTEFGNLAKENNTLIIPSDVSNVSSMVATAMSVIDKTKKQNK